jgi:hypothetical protein
VTGSLVRRAKEAPLVVNLDNKIADAVVSRDVTAA